MSDPDPDEPAPNLRAPGAYGILLFAAVLVIAIVLLIVVPFNNPLDAAPYLAGLGAVWLGFHLFVRSKSQRH